MRRGTFTEQDEVKGGAPIVEDVSEDRTRHDEDLHRKKNRKAPMGVCLFVECISFIFLTNGKQH